MPRDIRLRDNSESDNHVFQYCEFREYLARIINTLIRVQTNNHNKGRTKYLLIEIPEMHYREVKSGTRSDASALLAREVSRAENGAPSNCIHYHLQIAAGTGRIDSGANVFAAFN